MVSKEIRFTETLTVAVLTAYITPPEKIKPLSIPNEIQVKSIALSKYDGLLSGEVAV
jgi:hypothetical protein